jgi:hypothetical protein
MYNIKIQKRGHIKIYFAVSSIAKANMPGFVTYLI